MTQSYRCYFFALVLIAFCSPHRVQGADSPPLRANSEREEVNILAKAEGLLLQNDAAQAASLLGSVSLEGHHGPAILQVRTWALFESKAFKELALLLEATPHLKGEYRFLRGAARLRTGNWEGGKADLQSLWWNTPQTIWGIAALRELAMSNLPATYSPKERAIIERTIPAITYASRRSAKPPKQSVYKILQRKAPPKGALRHELKFAWGLRLLNNEKFTKAARVLRQALRTNKNINLDRVIELNLAEALRFKGTYKIAMKHFDHVAETGRDELRYKALSQAARMAIHYRKYSDAKKRYQALLITDPIGPTRQEALWGLGWVEFRNREYLRAQRFFETLFTEHPYGPRAPGAIYWSARCLQNLKQMPSAQSHLRALIERFPVDYYAYLATEVLKQNRNKNSAKQLATLPTKLTDPKVSHIEGLAQAGLRAKTRRALLNILPYASDYLSPRELDDLATTAHTIGLRQIAGKIRGIRNRRFPQPNASTIKTLAANFPGRYVNMLRVAAKANRLEPNLVVALARQESAFNPQAVSSAGALGLLQLMPTTATSLIREQKPQANPTHAEIMAPRLNAKLGTRYLGRMMRSFKGNTAYALAAYNAGPGAVSRWRERQGALPAEIFVEEIPYKETRLYVRKVLSWKRKFEFLLTHQSRLHKTKKKKQSRRVNSHMPRG